MNSRHVFRYTGFLIFFLGISMVVPIGISLIYADGCTRSLFYCAFITMAAGVILILCMKKNEDKTLSHRDGVAIVTFGWLSAGLFGALPFLLSGAVTNFTSAYFESISGFTTTGATIFSDIESLPPSIVIWRSITQWLGGMGIIVLSIAILPFLGIGGMQLYKAEIPSPVVDKLKPRISDTAKALWKVYILITILEIFFLFGGGMSLFDSLCHTFCTMPTGGFSPKNTSIAYYDNPYFDIVIIFFMLISGINFSLHYKFIKGNLTVYGRDPEYRVFFGFVILFILMVTINIYGSVYDSILSSLRYAAFQVSSIITTTGFVTADYGKWPAFSQSVLIFIMFLGGMAGSTGGGIKTMRIILMIKHGYNELFRIIHPHAVTTLKLGGKPVPLEIMNSIWGFFTLYMVAVVISTIIMALLGLDIISSLASVAACIFNVGPGLGVVGPVENYLAIPQIGKWVLIFCMLLGRLEIYTLIVMLMPAYWRR